MELSYVKKGLLLKWYNAEIAVRKIFRKKKLIQPACFEDLMQTIKKHEKIVVLASGPSALKLKPTSDAFYLVTNDSYKLVEHLDFLYYIKDGYYVHRFLAHGPFSEKHTRTLFYWLSEKENDTTSFRSFMRNARIANNHEFFFFSDLANSKQAEAEWNSFNRFITEEHQLPFKIQNSGIFLLLFGFYFAEKLTMPLEIYGLDLGVGGNFHFNKKGHMSDSITRESIKRNVMTYLGEMYISLGKQVKNHSNFYPN